MNDIWIYVSSCVHLAVLLGKNFDFATRLFNTCYAYRCHLCLLIFYHFWQPGHSCMRKKTALVFSKISVSVLVKC